MTPSRTKKASLADVLKAADRSGLYYQSITDGKTLLPMLLIDNDPVTIRDIERTKIDGNGKINPDVKHSAKNYRDDKTDGSMEALAENDDPEYKRVFKWSEYVDGKFEEREKISLVKSCSYHFTNEKVYSTPVFLLICNRKRQQRIIRK